MNITALNPFPRPAPPSAHADLRQAVGEATLLGLTLEAIQVVSGVLGRPGGEQPNPRMLLTLLTYCYASAWFSAEEIERLAGREPTLRYICARERVWAEDVRRFRRTQRAWVEHCLAQVIAQVWLRITPRPGFRGPDGAARHAAILQDAFANVQRRMRLALLLDAADCE